ncbi:hypothetical protein D3C76_1096550 [compost metagenome]
MIHYRQRVTPDTVSCQVLAFVISAPELVRKVGFLKWFGINGDTLAQPPRHHQSRFFKHVVDRGFGGWRLIWKPLSQGCLDLFRAWRGLPLAAQLKNGLFDRKRHSLSLRVALATALRQSVDAVRVVAGYPLVTGLATDAVSRTKLAEIKSTGQIVGNEHHFQVHRFELSPRHGQILGIDQCQLKTVTYVLELFCYLCG